jgi:hypothetical protein
MKKNYKLAKETVSGITLKAVRKSFNTRTIYYAIILQALSEGEDFSAFF